MSKLKLLDGTALPIGDYAEPKRFSVILSEDLDAQSVLALMTDYNLSVLQFETDAGAVTGIYYKQRLISSMEENDALIIFTNDIDLCRSGLVLAEDGRIIAAPPERIAPEGSVIVDELPAGKITDYRYSGGEFVYDPLPEEPQPEEGGSVWDELDEAYQEGVDSV